MREVRADQRPEDDDRERAEQRERELALVARLAPRDHRREEDAGRDERGGDPEDRQLHVPGAHQVVREGARQVEAEEARRGRRGSAATRRRRASGAGTAPPSRRRTRRSPAAPASARRRPARGTRASPARGRASRGRAPSGRTRRRACRSRRAARSATAPTRRSRSRSACCRRAAPAASCSCTSSCGRAGWPPRPRPSRRRTRSAAELRRVGDRVRREAVLGRRVGEEARVVGHEPPERRRLRAREGRACGRRVVAVRAQVLDRPLHRRSRSRGRRTTSRTRLEERRR